MSKEQYLNQPKPRRFQLIRDRDATGISGTGIVAEGIEFRDGTCVYKWTTTPSTMQRADRIEDVEHIHGHSGATTVRWVDDPDRDE